MRGFKAAQYAYESRCPPGCGPNDEEEDEEVVWAREMEGYIHGYRHDEGNDFYKVVSSVTRTARRDHASGLVKKGQRYRERVVRTLTFQGWRNDYWGAGTLRQPIFHSRLVREITDIRDRPRREVEQTLFAHPPNP